MSEPDAPHPQQTTEVTLTELSRLIRDALGPYAEAIRRFQSQSAQIVDCFVKAAKQWQDLLTVIGALLSQFSEIDWEAASQRYRAAIANLANEGWTLPHYASLDRVFDLSTKSRAELDQLLSDEFMANGARHLDELRDELMQSSWLAQWHSLLSEIFDSIKAGRHRIAVPAALTVLEGAIAHSLSQLNLIDKKETSPVSRLWNDKRVSRNDWHKGDDYDAFFWESAIIFLQNLFARSDFSAAEPSFLNRHWSLHGRSVSQWTSADALRLVSALYTLEFLFVSIGVPSAKS